VIRQLHVYLSVFVAPSLIFFAATGALQTFRIPDDKAAPVLLQKLARVHKDDVFAPKPARKPPPAAANRPRPSPPPPPPPAPAPEPAKRSTQMLKWFFSLVSVAVIVTSLLGLWMALVQHRRRVLLWVVFLGGTAAPILILML
jgi:hypothetical protein